MTGREKGFEPFNYWWDKTAILPEHGNDGDYMKLLVRDLNRSTTQEEIREMFEEYGRVQSCTLVMDAKTGVSKGFGFVEMPKPGEAKAAIKNLNGKLVAGQKIRVKKAEDKARG